MLRHDEAPTTLHRTMASRYLKITSSDVGLVCRNAAPASAAIPHDGFVENRPFVAVKNASLTSRLLHRSGSSLQSTPISIIV
jgi:hypothetical protein